MSNLSPARRLRTKTSDLTDFFRGAGHSSNQARHQDVMLSTSSATLEVPSGDEEGGTRKKITRIPLFGRSRKKSNQSATSSPYVSSTAVRESSDIGEQSSRGPSPDRRRSEHSAANVHDGHSTSSSRPPVSLGSKLAAHFAHSRPSKQAKAPAEVARPLPEPRKTPSPSPSGLAPPATRSASFDSGSSSGSKSRSTTPRPPQPVITVSLSSDNSEFKDLFTRPKRPVVPLSKFPNPSNVEPGSSEPSIYKRGYTPASAIAAAVRDQHNSEVPRSSSRSSRASTSISSSKQPGSRKNSDSDKSGSSTPRLSEARESPRPIPPEKDRVLPPSLQRRSSVATGSGQASENSSASLRSRMKQPVTRPPSMPLPLLPASAHSTPPPSSPPSSPLPDPPLNASLPAKVENEAPKKVHIRPRAHTIGSVGNTPLPSPTGSITPLTSASTIVPRVGGSGNLDIDTASAEELRQALRARNKDYEELSASMLKMKEIHAAEVNGLEKKIALLEKENRKLETQIKGFTWLLKDGEAQQPKPPGIAASNSLRLTSSRAAVAAGESLSDRDGYRIPQLAGARRLVYQSDSGAESHPTSGAESLRASGASGSESMASGLLRKSKLRRLYLTGDGSHGVSRTGSILRPSTKGPPAANSEKPLPEAPNSKRLSLNSASTSPSSSTSSLLPPSPSITMSSLSAIPEAGDAGNSVRFAAPDGSETSDDRRGLRQSRRISASSLTSSSTAASSSYSTNVKRSPPPSIAQVLEKSPKNFGDVLDKLRPFS